MSKKIIWLGVRTDEHLLPILLKKGCTIQYLDDIEQCQTLQPPVDYLICCAPEVEMQIEDLAAGLPVMLYEPRSFTHGMFGHDTRFAFMAKLAQQAEAVVCRDEASGQWWSCFNHNVYLLNGAQAITAPSAFEVRIAEMIVEDYLAGCSFAVKQRVGLWGKVKRLWRKVKRYYKEFGLRQTLRRIYEKLTGSEY